jgi:hypothetical protein
MRELNNWDIQFGSVRGEDDVVADYLPPPETRKLIDKLDEAGDITYLCDAGEHVFWTSKNKGYLTASNLRVIADELDRRTAKQDKD